MTDPVLALATAAQAHATLAATAVAGRNLRLGDIHTKAARALLERIPDDVIDADLTAARLEVLDARVRPEPSAVALVDGGLAITPRTADLADEVRPLIDALLDAYHALRFTQEYASAALPNLAGWSHYDGRVRIAQVVARYGIALPLPDTSSARSDLGAVPGFDSPTRWWEDWPHDEPPTALLSQEQDDEVVRLIGRLSGPPVEYDGVDGDGDSAELLVTALHAAVHAITPTALATAHERRRQIDGEGYEPDHDAAHPAGQLITAAACYLSIVHEGADGRLAVALDPAVPAGWPWEPEAWKPSTDPVRNLVKAAALICAEGDRDAALANTGDEPF